MRPSIFALAGVLVGLAVGGASLAGASASGGSSQTSRFRETVTSFATVDVGAAGVSPGDEAIYHLQVRTLKGKLVGTNDGVCTVLTPVSNALAHCVGTVRLPGGNLEWAGDLPLTARRFTLAATGGTGVYRDAAGEAIVRWENPPTNTKALVTVHLDG